MRVLFVCLGNICRSPTAEGVFRRLLAERGLEDVVSVDSCGIGSWHLGKAPDSRAQAAALRRGIDLSPLRARQLCVEDFYRFDYLLAMDHDNLAAIEALRPADSSAEAALFLTYAGYPERAVPDPYYGGEHGFEEVIDLIEAASQGFVETLRERLEARRS
ncbi:low molecular weight protein-tyrosine-phosphatase [Billgrantia gudaonensis]|uniref:protein-tyrosine-phosphatase n=1 Tax=Billgrantia gudaonensis TaxID=376427 RepID=A0A1G8NA22_9GAMM|nr:low molecular weight protein-tyrosine-phosphatase [Halomonas gudaonensis]SDI76936.1 protein-tyrosine phosphatase [Halomonas gudaonensis]